MYECLYNNTTIATMTIDMDRFLDVCFTSHNIFYYAEKYFENKKEPQCNIKDRKNIYQHKHECNTNDTQNKKIQKIQKEQQTAEQTHFTFMNDKSHDGYYWVFYILYFMLVKHNDTSEICELYNHIHSGKIKFQTIQEFKYEMIQSIKTPESKQLLKTKKVKQTDVIQNLGTVENITYNTLKGLLLLFNIPVCITKNGICEYVVRDIENIDALWKIIISKDSISLCEESSINDLEKEYHVVSSLNKPFKSITSYTLKELQTLATKFKIETTKRIGAKIKNKTKKKLYEEILQKI